MENTELQNENALPQTAMPKAALIGEVSADQVLAWKKEHGDVFQVVVDGHAGYLKRPNRSQLAYAIQQQSNPLRSNETLLKACWLGGSMEIQTKDAYFLGVQGQLQQLVEIKAAEISKL